ncbi:hypothetical protein KFL_000060610 [Klebsormidium nitens]|uniref:Uncharacterized protein n=1 Tax=Klebsormidium nitens TaxID=105231 RepID=A0A0U9HQL6_KLENI|nr:hypothetical protein KFL_000060610 [Klebsormidium nitens]|eukprot:GAQ77995.1 hypothetical protein KFL_000060610 [Klebsormidium nitens]
MVIKGSLPIASSPAPSTLAGPKGLAAWQQRQKQAGNSSTSAEGGSDTNPFLSMLSGGALQAGFQHIPRPPMGYTENGSWTFTQSGSACLDFFFQVVADTPPERVRQLLEAAWKEDPLLALKLLFHLRGVRGTGKSEKGGFYTGGLWLVEQHPGTLLGNLRQVGVFGYYKDLLEIVLRVLEGPQETAQRAQQKATHDAAVKAGKARAARKESGAGVGGALDASGGLVWLALRGGRKLTKGEAARVAKRAGTLKPREERIALQLEKDKAASERVRKEREYELAARAVRVYAHNGSYRALHDAVADVFAEQLARDVESLRSGRPYDVSLAAKWAPSPDKSYDRATLLCEAIARRMFPRGAAEAGLSEAEYAARARDQLRRAVLTPLRAALAVPEVLFAAQRWHEVQYARVPSVCMRMNKDVFVKHDKERFEAFLADVAAGKTKIAAGAVLPHEVLQEAVTGSGAGAEVAERQWERIVADLKQKGSLANCMAVCDVSGSMYGTPIQVAIALGMLVAELAEAPWGGKLITFSANPQMHEVRGGSLREKYSFVEQMDWDMNTDFQKVFDNMLALAQATNLPPDAMLRRLFVFSDMEFDEASTRPYQTDYAEIERKFREAGYGTPPEIVFWNLRDTSSTPVIATQRGVAMVSGFSKNILKLFLDNDGDIDPMVIVRKAVTGPEYEKLTLVD